MKIRKAKLDDISDIVDIWAEMADYHATLNRFFSRRDDAKIVFNKYLSEKIGENDWLLLIADDSDKILGYSLGTLFNYLPVYTDICCGYIQDIGVAIPYRRKGIGKMLVQEMTRWFSKKCVKRIEIEMICGNHDAYAFWKTFGFTDYTLRMERTGC